MTNDSRQDPPVGYGNPPLATRFKPGQSGNPSGRPKRVRSLRAELLDELGEVMRVHEGGSDAVELTKGRAIVKSLVQAAVDGNLRAATTLLTFFGKSSRRHRGATRRRHRAGGFADRRGLSTPRSPTPQRRLRGRCRLFNTTIQREYRTMTKNEITLLRNDFLSFASKLFSSSTARSQRGWLP